MRLGVLDVGSNTAHLLVVDARRGAHPRPAHSKKTLLRLAERIGPAGELRADGVDALVEAVAAARDEAARVGAAELVGYATSAVRDATNSAEVLARVHAETGMRLEVLSGPDEARLTFLAARRWFGWSAGRLLSLDIGGGSLEIAVGLDEEPEVALSLPLGAGRLAGRLAGAAPPASGDPGPTTADGAAGPAREVAGAPPAAEALRRLREHVEATIEPVVERVRSVGWDRAVASSRTFRTLARLAGAPPPDAGLWARRTLTRTGLRQVIGFLRHIPPARLGELPGVDPGRAGQVLPGAVLAEAVLSGFDIDAVEICPWALREGMIFRRLDQLAA